MIKGVSRVLLIRTDKIGDVVLTTPAIAALRKKIPEGYLAGLVSTQAEAVYRGNPHLDRVLVLSNANYSGVAGFMRLVRDLRREKFQVAIAFYTNFFVAFAVLVAGIRYRIGPYSKVWSWLVFNLGRRQNRSAVEMHEADYNIQLLREFDITVASADEKPHLRVDVEKRTQVDEIFEKLALPSAFKTVVIHPGMAGSALNWPESHFAALGRRLAHRYNIVITGGPGEDALVERVFQGVLREQNYAPDQPSVAKYVGTGDLGLFIAFLDRCDAVVAPSTGPMHLAVALGKKVVTVFSPIRVQSAVRWGPYGVRFGTNLGVDADDQASVLVPDVNCAENYRCALSACMYYPCMPRISVEDVEAQVLALLEGGSISMFKGAAVRAYDIDEVYEDAEL